MRHLTVFLLAALLLLPATADELPSWKAGANKQAILDFIQRTTDSSGPDYVPPEERVAVFDNDGTLWSEKPAYFQLLFAFDRLRELAEEHPEWKTEQPFKAAIEGDWKTVAASGEKGLFKLVMASHAGGTTEEFAAVVGDWIKTARHPRFKRPYTDLVYQPMLELLEALRNHGYKTYIVSGGGVEFLRVWSEEVYGIPPEQVVGSSIVTRFEYRDGRPVLVRRPKLDFVDDKEGKPVGIHKFIGRRPVIAVGNSDGDLQMLQWTRAGKGPSMAVVIHHTDSAREWAYDRDSKVGHLDRALEEGRREGWTIVDMARDWNVIYPFNKEAGR